MEPFDCTPPAHVDAPAGCNGSNTGIAGPTGRPENMDKSEAAKTKKGGNYTVHAAAQQSLHLSFVIVTGTLKLRWHFLCKVVCKFDYHCTVD